jgi:ABC-2 type transport system permease protein
MSEQALDRGALRDMHGPSAFAGSARRFFHLTWLIAKTEFRLTYFGSVLGYLWSLMRPLLMFGVLYAVFTQVVRFGDDIPNYPVLLLLNIVCFNFFTEVTGAAVTSVLQRENLVRKMQFPRIVIPLSVVITALLNLLVNLIAVFAFVLAYGVQPRWSWLLFPLALLPIILTATGVALLLSALYVRFRDVAPIWSVASTALFYGTPILYVIDKVPAGFRSLVLANPIAASLEQMRAWVIDPGAPGVAAVMGGALAGLIPLAVVAVVCAVGLWVFDHEAPLIAERV